MTRSRWLIGFLLLLPVVAYGWNSTGHRLVAQIAYDQLTPNARQQIKRLVKKTHRNQKPEQAFVNSASWPDRIIYSDDIHAFDSWHYIAQPWVTGDNKPPPLEQHNVVWAILQAEAVLSSHKATTDQKAIFLRFLVHFVGDVHQPLHAIELYSRRFPNGDAGGNFYKLNAKSRNLHALWDSGVGAFSRISGKTYPSSQTIMLEAKQLEKNYPFKQYYKQAQQLSPEQWANESYTLAKEFVYRTPYAKKPSKRYRKRGQELAKQRVALAGYRLGMLLNRLFS